MASQTGRPSCTPATTPVLRVDLSSPVPPYEQLRAQIGGLIAGGQLQPGRRLPSVRQLAADLGLAPGTVVRAYSELEAAGLLITRRRGGTFVAERDSPAGPAAARQRKLATAADEYVATVQRLGLGADAAQAAVSEAIARLGAKP